MSSEGLRLCPHWTIDPITNSIWCLSNTDVSPSGRKVEKICQITEKTTLEPRIPSAWWPPRPLVITYEEVLSEGDADNPPVVVAKKVESVSSMGISPEVLRSIGIIHARVEAFGRRLETDLDKPSPRSDLLATQEQLNSLEKRINAVRHLLFTYGKPITESSDYPEWKEDEWRTFDEQRKFYLDQDKYGDDCFSAMADMEAPKSKGPENGIRLLFIYTKAGESGVDIIITFDFVGNFNLEIDFQKKLKYDSLNRALTEMTSEEYRIINGYLEQHAINLAS